MKIIIIEKCGDCPYCRTEAETSDEWCIKDNSNRNVDKSKIPDWCPLENADSTTFCKWLLKIFDNNG